jgi:sulfonate transport system substrate-binding protein
MTPLRRLAIAAAAFGLLLLAACSGQGAKHADKLVRIIVGGTDVKGRFAPSGLSGAVASDGWLESQLAKSGFKLRFVDMPHAIGGPMINESFVNKSVEFAYYGDLPAVIGASGGAPIRLVMPFNGGTNAYLLVAPNSPAKSIADLRGKRIALHRGRPWEAVFARLIESQGLTVADFKIMNVNPSAGAAALAAGKVDAFVGPIADANRLTEQGAGRILWSTKTAPKAWASRTELFGRSDFVDANPEAARLVAAAYVRAAQWASRPENRDAYIKSISLETPERAIRADLEGSGDWKTRFSPLSSEDIAEHYRAIIDYAAATGLIAHKPNIAPLIDTSLVAPAVQLAGAGGYWAAGSTQVAQSGAGTQRR